MEKFLPYAHQSIDDSDVASVAESLKSDLITRGSFVEEFEKVIADYCGAKYAVAFNSATSALFAACFAAKVNRFDRILTSPNTYIASVSSGVSFGATPVFIDIDRNTGNLDLEKLALNLEYQTTRGRNIIVPVHFSGLPVDMQKLNRMISEPNVVIIEDAAHAMGSAYADGQKVGSCAYSDMTVFSFHPAKTMTTGEGGMVTTNNPEYCERLKLYRNNGIVKCPELWKYEVVEIGGNFNFTEMQAALGLSQFKRLDKFVAKRRELMALYRQKLPAHIRMFTSEYDAHTAFHLCVVQMDFKTSRSEVMNQLKAKGIGTQLHYIPVYRHPVFSKKNGDISSFFPEMEAYYSKALSLPLYYDLTPEDVDRVVKALVEIT